MDIPNACNGRTADRPRLDDERTNELEGPNSINYIHDREVIKGQNRPDYSLLGDQLISNQILETIRNELLGVTRHNDATKVFERYDIKAHSQALSLLGYKVKWSGLDPDNAEILKI